MRRLLLSTTALILLSAPVFADPPDRGGRGEGHGHADRGPAPQPAAPPQRGFERGDRGGDHGPRPQAAAPSQRGFERGDRGGDQGPGRQAAIQPPPDRGQMRGDQNRGDQNRGDWRGDRRPQASLATPQPSPQFNRDDRTRGDRRSFNDNRNDVRPDFNRDGRTGYRGQRFNGLRHDFSGFRDFHRNFQASRRFRAPGYYRRPAGWYSHRWAFGEFLPAAFWVRDYWLIDFADYYLPPPPYGAVWVRVDRDALLIDEDSGEIITVAYDVFY